MPDIIQMLQQLLAQANQNVQQSQQQDPYGLRTMGLDFGSNQGPAIVLPGPGGAVARGLGQVVDETLPKVMPSLENMGSRWVQEFERLAKQGEQQLSTKSIAPPEGWTQGRSGPVELPKVDYPGNIAAQRTVDLKRALTNVLKTSPGYSNPATARHFSQVLPKTFSDLEKRYPTLANQITQQAKYNEVEPQKLWDELMRHMKSVATPNLGDTWDRSITKGGQVISQGSRGNKNVWMVDPDRWIAEGGKHVANDSFTWGNNASNSYVHQANDIARQAAYKRAFPEFYQHPEGTGVPNFAASNPAVKEALQVILQLIARGGQPGM